jgi:hypothetical protein
MPIFRKKPVEIEARKYTEETRYDVIKWCNAGLCASANAIAYHDGYALIIRTLEGQHVASVGDWIIKGVAGEFYPCKPDIFAATYDAV